MPRPVIDPKTRAPVSASPPPKAQPVVPRSTAAASARERRTESSFEKAHPSEGKGLAALGVTDDSVGVNDDSVGVNDDSVGVNDDSVGVNDDSVGVNDDSVGVNDDSVGVNDDSVGPGPLRGESEIRRRALAFARAETPTYLRSAPRTQHTPVGLLLPRFDATAKAVLAQAEARTFGLPAALRFRLVHALHADPRGIQAQLVSHSLRSNTWTLLDEGGRAQLASVMLSAGERGLRLLARLMETQPRVLQSRDGLGGTLLETLVRLTGAAKNGALLSAGLAPERLVSDVLQDLVNPAHINQGTAPTCTVASMQYELARKEPAEFARLMTDLVSTSGVAMMASGGKLVLQTGYVVPTPGESRSSSEVIFQSAAMEYANGLDDFMEGAGLSKGLRDGNPVHYRGLFSAQQQKILEKLFQVPFRTAEVTRPSQAAEILATLNRNRKQLHTLPVIFEIDRGRFNHAVTFLREQGGRIYYRDPYGADRSMSTSDFAHDVCAVHLPRAFV